MPPHRPLRPRRAPSGPHARPPLGGGQATAACLARRASARAVYRPPPGRSTASRGALPWSVGREETGGRSVTFSQNAMTPTRSRLRRRIRRESLRRPHALRDRAVGRGERAPLVGAPVGGGVHVPSARAGEAGRAHAAVRAGVGARTAPSRSCLRPRRASFRRHLPRKTFPPARSWSSRRTRQARTRLRPRTAAISPIATVASTRRPCRGTRATRRTCSRDRRLDRRGATRRGRTGARSGRPRRRTARPASAGPAPIVRACPARRSSRSSRSRPAPRASSRSSRAGSAPRATRPHRRCRVRRATARSSCRDRGGLICRWATTRSRGWRAVRTWTAMARRRRAR